MEFKNNTQRKKDEDLGLGKSSGNTNQSKGSKLQDNKLITEENHAEDNQMSKQNSIVNKKVYKPLSEKKQILHCYGFKHKDVAKAVEKLKEEIPQKNLITYEQMIYVIDKIMGEFKWIKKNLWMKR